jgi:hypothetical protein
MRTARSLSSTEYRRWRGFEPTYPFIALILIPFVEGGPARGHGS